MSELCNILACFSVEIKVTSDICVTFVVYACGKSILGVRTYEKLSFVHVEDTSAGVLRAAIRRWSLY